VVALAEIGDKTQLLALLLATKFKRPWPIVLGILVATLANHTFAGAVGTWLVGLVGAHAETEAVERDLRDVPVGCSGHRNSRRRGWPRRLSLNAARVRIRRYGRAEAAAGGPSGVRCASPIVKVRRSCGDSVAAKSITLAS